MIWMLLDLIDWVQLWKGMSPCTSPGVGDCVVWWEAWGVVASIAVGLATTSVAILAGITSRQATDIANEAKNIAAKQKEDADRLTEAQRKGVEQMLYHEVAGIAIELETLREILGYGIDHSMPNSVGDAGSLNYALKRCQEDWLPVTKSVQDKLYLLNNGHGEVLAQLIGASVSISAIANDISSDWSCVPASQGEEGDSWVYSGDGSMLDLLWNAIDEVAVTSTFLSSQFVRDVKRVRLH